MAEESKHTPTPWEIRSRHNDDIMMDIVGPRDVSSAYRHAILVCSKENAVFIVEAVNSYEALVRQRGELVAALEGIIEWHEDDESITGVLDIGRTALARVRAKESV